MSILQRSARRLFMVVCASVFLGATIFAPRVHVSASAYPACTPSIDTRHGLLPEPPVVTVKPGQTITLDVLEGPTPAPGGTQSYCYVIAGSTARYVDAPTIQVHQGETFTLKLVDQIPMPSASPGTSTMAPQPEMTAADGCALLPYEPPMPPPQATPGYLGHQRVYATMAPELPNDTNFHTHGWHVSPDVDNVFKSLARSEGGMCTYTFAVPLSQPAGTYWYHAHLHGLAQQQVGGGLAGALIVLPVQPSATPLPDRVILLKNSTYAVDKAPTNRLLEANLALAQVKQNSALTMAAQPTPLPSFDPFNPPPWPSGWPIPVGASRCSPPPPPKSFMSHWVVNGYPVGDPEVSVPQPAIALLPTGARQRYRIIDGMSDSYANIELLDPNGKQENLDVIARDGVPINPREDIVVPFKNVLVPPAGRVDIVVTGMSGTQTLIANTVCTGYLGEYIPLRKILVIKPSQVLRANRVAIAPLHIAKPAQTSADALYHLSPLLITKRRAITFTQYANGQGAWYVTDTSSDPAGFIEHPFWLTADPANPQKYLPEITVPQNSVEDWTLINASGEIHAFHIHQLTFVTLSNPEFEGPHLPVLQDTVALPPARIVPIGPVTTNPFLEPTKTIIRIDFRHVDKGTFVFHCHMLFHEDRGMMAIIRVV